MDDDAKTRMTVRPASVPPVAAAETIGRYRVVSQIGAGGMGVVLKAWDPSLGRIVAIKRLSTEASTELEALRLHREAQAIAQLSHPNVIAVYEVGSADGGMYVAMEYVEGLTLAKLIEQRRPRREEILRLFTQAARGLAAAHDAGIVHRDFKPANVLVGNDGRVRVLDFGIARRLGSEDGERPTSSLRAGMLHEDLTKSGAMLGTPRYMAPEQFMGLDVDARADRFAFSVALYEALTFTRPFDGGESMMDLAMNVIHGRIRSIPSELGLPVWLSELVSVGLAPKPEDRGGDMRDVVAELERDRGLARRASLDGSSTDDLLAAFPPPEDAETAERVAWLRARLEHAAELKRMGDFAGALGLAALVVREAEEVEYGPLRAASLYTLGSLQHRMGDAASARATLYTSAEVAAAAGDDWQVANVWVALVGVVGGGLSRFEEAEALARVASVAIMRLGGNPAFSSRLANARGRNLLRAGHGQEALRAYEIALALDEEVRGPDHPLVAVTLANAAEVELVLERPATARVRLDRAVEILKRANKRGPTLARCWHLVGRAYLAESRFLEASRALESARVIFGRYPDRAADLRAVEAALATCGGG
jgi:tetratricopeptide (TPR) repeat protein/predicted Ser/Thr protein kinase